VITRQSEYITDDKQELICFRRNDAEEVIGVLGRVMEVKLDEDDNEWKATTFVATDANSLHSELLNLQKVVNNSIAGSIILTHS